jgi:adenosylhomocysteine nucleosidase
MIPATIIEMDTGEEFETGGGQGVLVSSPQVLDVHEKRRVRRQYSAAAVDMEAAAVAGVARKHGVPFMAIKAISDDTSFSMPEFGRWIDQQGTLHTGRFLAAHLLRPMSWSRMARLAINSRRASRKLCEVLAHHIEQQSFHRQGASPREALSPKRN